MKWSKISIKKYLYILVKHHKWSMIDDRFLNYSKAFFKKLTWKTHRILHLCVQLPWCIAVHLILCVCVCVFSQHIPTWTLNLATPTIWAQITHKPSLPPHPVASLPSYMAWWEMTTFPGGFPEPPTTEVPVVHDVINDYVLLFFFFFYQGASQSSDPPRIHGPGL